ncbi:hypothetical protein BH23ACT10_BH23ACT10_19750 [soil metagenome]
MTDDRQRPPVTDNHAVIDRARLELLLGGDDLGWLRARVRQRVEQGGAPAGTARLTDPSPQQRAAADRLMGRRPTTGTHVAVSLDAIDQMLRDARVCDGLAVAVAELDGPVRNRRAQRVALDTAWSRVAADAAEVAAAHPDGDAWRQRWITELTSTGLLRRLAADPSDAALLLAQASEVLAALPAEGVTTAGLAARVLGDSHGLDDGRRLATVVLKAIQHRTGIASAGGLPAGDERRALWASVGVLGDELSSTVLALGLRGDDTATLTGAVVALHADAGEPVRLTLSQLVRHPVQLGHLRGTTVFVCENPAVVAAAARQLGARCAPLVCVEGQPSAAAQLLLRHLADAGAALAYHGDFDWPGLRIGRFVIDRFDARPWRFSTADYDTAPGGPPLRGRPADAPWDAALSPAMTARGTAVHEEQVLDMLLTDMT